MEVSEHTLEDDSETISRTKMETLFDNLLGARCR